MVQINFGQREVSCKVVFYGPGMSGKTTNLEIIHKKAPKEAVGEMVSIATETDRTLYFDFLPLDLGQVAGMRTKFQLYTVPGQIYYNATRKLVLQGVDGIIFVADSNPDKMAENLESLQNLRDNLAEMNLTTDDMPLVLQYNKRDLPNALSVADMNAQMNPMGAPTFEACARDGKGVFATLKEISRLVIEKLNKEHAPAATRRRTNNSQPPAGAAPVPAPLPPASRPAAPAPVPSRPAASPQAVGAGSAAARSAVPAPGAVAQGTPARGNPTIPAGAVTANARDRHLAKGKPPALDNRAGARNQEPVPTPTDPNLKRYQEDARTGQAAGPLKLLLTILVVVVICVLMLIVAVLFVPSVRALLPQSMQQRMFGGDAPAEQPAAAPATGGAHGQ